MALFSGHISQWFSMAHFRLAREARSHRNLRVGSHHDMRGCRTNPHLSQMIVRSLLGSGLSFQEWPINSTYVCAS
jgi:hypothetical protein